MTALLERAWEYIPWDVKHRHQNANAINCDIDDINLEIDESGRIFAEIFTGSLDFPFARAEITTQHRKVLEAWWFVLDAQGVNT